jgi:hypothetical protein
MVFDLATATLVARREDALFLGPPGTGESHLVQAIGQAVIGQGYRVIYREAHILLEEIAEAALNGKRKEHMELLATVPLLIIDDLGMRKFKRKRRLQELRTRLENRRPDSPGKVPTVEGVQKNVKGILRGRHMADLFAVQVRQNRAGLPRLSFRFRDKAYQHLRSTLLGKTLLFTDRTDWSDEQIVLAYRAQHHVEADFRRLKDPHYLTFRPAFHWTDQKLRVHAFYCVLALLMLNLLRRKLAQAGIR